MSSTILSSSSASFILNNALQDYTQQTGVDLTKYDFANQIECCGSPYEVLWLLRDKAEKFEEYRDGNHKLIDWITPVIHVFAGFLEEATSIGSTRSTQSPEKIIFAGVDVLLTAAIDISSSYDTLVDLFECVGIFVRRLSIYTDIPLTNGMMDILVRIMVEVLSVLALATKQIKQGRFKKIAKVLIKGGGDIGAVLQRLDRLTEDEARMTVMQALEIVYGLVKNVKLVMDNGNVSMYGIRQALVSMQGTVTLVNKTRRESPKLAFPSRPLDEPKHHIRGVSSRNRVMVFPGQRLRGVESDRSYVVDSWEARLRKEYSHLFNYPGPRRRAGCRISFLGLLLLRCPGCQQAKSPGSPLVPPCSTCRRV